MSLPLVSASINKVYNSERRNDKRLIKNESNCKQNRLAEIPESE